MAVVSWAFLIVLAVVGLLLLGGLVAIIAMLINPKTRVVGIVLLAIVVLGVAMVGAVGFYLMLDAPVPTAPVMPAWKIPLPPPLVPGVKTIVPVVETMEGETAEEDATEESPTTVPEAVTEARPEWVDASPQRIDSGDVFQTSVAVGPYISRLECDTKLPGVLNEAVQEYASTTIGPKAHGRISLPPDFLTEQLAVERWQEAVQTSFGPMVQLHVLARFDANVQQRIEQDVESAWQQKVKTERLWLAGIGMFFILGFLAILFVGLKITRRSDSGHQSSKTEPDGDKPQPRSVRVMVMAVLVAFLMSMLVAFRAQKGSPSPEPMPEPSQSDSDNVTERTGP